KQVLIARELVVEMLALEPQENEFALPPRNGRNQGPLRVLCTAGRLGIVITPAQDPALRKTRNEVQERAVSVGGHTRLARMQPIAFGAKCHISASTCVRGTVNQTQVEAQQGDLQIEVAVVTAGCGKPELRVGGARELPEILKPPQQSWLMTALVKRLALGGGCLNEHLVSAAG